MLAASAFWLSVRLMAVFRSFSRMGFTSSSCSSSSCWLPAIILSAMLKSSLST